MLRFISFTSGSCGNCYYLGEDSNPGVLIDAGRGLRTIKSLFFQYGLSMNNLYGILVSHEHLDHIRYLGGICKKAKKTVWCAPELRPTLCTHPFTKDQVPPFLKCLDKDNYVEVAPGVMVRYFEVPHDAKFTSGFSIKASGRTVVFVTDCGQITDEIIKYASEADTVIIESNHDRNMLLNGDYADWLKVRIDAVKGHLNNDECADAIKRFYHPGLKNLFLCHLSGNNNTPEIALETARKALLECGADLNQINLRTLHRDKPTELMTL